MELLVPVDYSYVDAPRVGCADHTSAVGLVEHWNCDLRTGDLVRTMGSTKYCWVLAVPYR